MDQLPVERLPVDERIRQALRHVMDLVAERAPGKVERAILYGSVARGDARPDSDVDLLMVWRGPFLEGLDVTVKATTQVLLETGINVAVQVMGREDFERQLALGAAFLQNVEEEGIRVS